MYPSAPEVALSTWGTVTAEHIGYRVLKYHNNFNNWAGHSNFVDRDQHCYH